MSVAPAANVHAAPRSGMSLRTRLTLWVVAIFAIIQFSSLSVFWLYERAAISQAVNDNLLDHARGIVDEVRQRIPLLTRAELDHLVETEMRFSQFRLAVADVLDQSGERALAPPIKHIDWARAGIAEPPVPGRPVFPTLSFDHFPDAERDRESLRAVAVGFPVGEQTWTLALGAVDVAFPARMKLITEFAVISAIVSSLAAAASAWFVAGIAIAPLERLRGMAERLDPTTIGREIEQDARAPEVARLTEELEKARRRIQLAFIAQERFLSNVSHEIKTPIAVMLTEAQTLDLSGCPTHIAEFISNSEEEMIRLGKLVESFLTLTRIQDGKGLARMKSYAVNDLVMDSVQNCSMMAGQYRIRLAPRLLTGDDHVEVCIEGEPNLLRTMVENLIRNAIRFSPEHGAVEVEAFLDSGNVCIAVRDRGPGIPPERLETIFDRFSHANERHGRGHGLGLAISQGIAELHRGAIRAQNRPDGGCEFTITLPLPVAAQPLSA